MGELLHLVQRGGDWAGPQPAQACPRCTKCNSPPITQSNRTRFKFWWSAAQIYETFIHGLVARSQGYAYATLSKPDTGVTNGPAMERSLACQWGKNSWQCAWRCVGMRVRWNTACHLVARILKCSKSFPRFHDLSRRNWRATFVSLREQFVNYEQTRRNYWVTRRANACSDVNNLIFSPRPGTHYPHPYTPMYTVTIFIGTSNCVL